MKIGRLLAIACVSACFTTSSLADVIILSNGDRMTGTIDSVIGGFVLLDTEHAGRITIETAAVAQMQSDGKYEVATATASTLGTFAVQDGVQVIQADGVSMPIAIAGIASAGKDTTGMEPEWTSRADLSAIISNGNSDTASYNALIQSVLKQETVEHALSLLISNEEAEEVTIKDQIDLDYGYKRFLSEKWYASGNGEYFQDRIKGIDQRVTVGAGVGYQFWDDSFGALSTDVSLNYVREDLDGQVESNPAVRWGLAYNRWLMAKQLEFFHVQSVLFIPDSDRGEVIQSSTGFRYALSDSIDAAVRADMNHETEPPAGNSKTDVTYTIGIGVRF